MRRLICLALCGFSIAGASAADYRERLAEDEIVYFVLPDRFENGDPSNDRGGLAGDRLTTGFDPAHKGFYHGGDLKGLIARLDYISGLGATAIWLGPIYKNKPVQGGPGRGERRLSRLLDHRLHPRRSALRRRRRHARLRRRGARARHEGLSRHHHQPHRRRDPVQGVRGPALSVPLARRTIHIRARAVSRGPRSIRASPGMACASKRQLLEADRPGLRVHAVRAPGRSQREGAGLAQFPYLLPQPRQLGLLGRELAVRGFRRPRRPHDRESARRQGFIDIYGDWIGAVQASTVSASTPRAT